MSARLDVFCAWGEGPSDVGINVHIPAAHILNSGLTDDAIVPIDLTSKRAREVAAELTRAADEADRIERLLQEDGL